MNRLAPVLPMAVVLILWPLRILLEPHRRPPDPRRADALIIPGTAQYDGRPSAQFAARLDHAITLWRRNPALRIITVGSCLPGDRYTEADVGAAYVQAAGVTPDSIEAVPVGNDTRGSFSAVVKEKGGRGEVIIVTDPNHCLRARMIAREVGFGRVSTAPAPGTPTRFPGAPWAWTLLHESAGLAVADLRRLPFSAPAADKLEHALRAAAGRLRPSRNTRYRHLDRDRT
ncbi:YdcF family protein [Corynebacterium sp. CCM 9203]|uniref:YdcF family protein n=1 Tax=Corynebacterium sp. CCM 9203 TaxID=3057615 RepID=UPI0035239BA9